MKKTKGNDINDINDAPTVIPADTDLETLSSGVYNQPVRESNYPNQHTYKIPPFNRCVYARYHDDRPPCCTHECDGCLWCDEVEEEDET